MSTSHATTRYFFDVIERGWEADSTGQELPDAAAAQAEGIRRARGMIAAEPGLLKDGALQMEIRDEQQSLLLRIVVGGGEGKTVKANDIPDLALASVADGSPYRQGSDEDTAWSRGFAAGRGMQVDERGVDERSDGAALPYALFVAALLGWLSSLAG